MMALNVSNTFWMGTWWRSATAMKGKFSWQVSAMSTMLQLEVSEGSQVKTEKGRQEEHKEGRGFIFTDLENACACSG